MSWLSQDRGDNSLERGPGQSDCWYSVKYCWMLVVSWSLSLSGDLTWVVIIKFYINYQSQLSLFVGCILVVMKSLSSKTNKHYLQSYHRTMGQGAANHYEGQLFYYSVHQSVSPSVSTTTLVLYFLPSSPDWLSKSTLPPSQQNLISITKISPQIIWHIISWRKNSRSDTSTIAF